MCVCVCVFVGGCVCVCVCVSTEDLDMPLLEDLTVSVKIYFDKTLRPVLLLEPL